MKNTTLYKNLYLTFDKVICGYVYKSSVNTQLINLIKEISKIRHPFYIEQIFNGFIEDYEQSKGSIHPKHKEIIRLNIEKVWNNYPEGERELYNTGKYEDEYGNKKELV
jgi:hypothetical protein